ncbi:MAG: aldolase, partial [Nitrospina sp.]|nr:aldolase [Nitrospina sp.]
MLFNHRDEVTNQLKNIATQDNGGVKIEDADKLRGDVLDQLVQNAVLNPSAEIKGLSRFLIKSAALELGIVNSSIQGLYDARGRGEVKGFTVPALNIRGMPYELCRAIFRTAIKSNAGAFIFELAKSEMSYTFQEPTELSTVILAAAIKEGFTGPVFI